MKKNKRESFWHDEDKAIWIPTIISVAALITSIVLHFI